MSCIHLGTDLLSAVIGLSAALGVALLFAGAIFTAMVLCLCARKYIYILYDMLRMMLDKGVRDIVG